MNAEQVEQSITKLAEAAQPLTEVVLREYQTMNAVYFGIALGFVVLTLCVALFSKRILKFADEDEAKAITVLVVAIFWGVALLVAIIEGMCCLGNLLAPHYTLPESLLGG